MQGTPPVQSTEAPDVRSLLRESPVFGLEEIQSLGRAFSREQISEARQEVEALRAEVDESLEPSPAHMVRVGVGLYLLGWHEDAHGYLSQIRDDPIGCYYDALILTALGRYSEAEQRFADAASLGYDSVECVLRRASAIRAQGQLDEAEALLRGAAAEGATRAEYSYQMGCILADRGDTFGAIEYFERAVDMDPHHARALFSLAGENCLHGNDAEAIRLYERSLAKPPQYVGALLNLGLLYEDAENYAAAAYCFRRILDADPNHGRARLYLKDIEATSDMYYDEESAREEFRLRQLLDRPITDFELTVRSRNCLEKIGLRSLGDMTRVSEQELLASRNFGETSLSEIRELMVAHGLRIGQNVGQAPARVPEQHDDQLSPEQRTLLDKPVSDLNLSVRARKCMTRLGIGVLGELVRRTADELLASKNFGVTSLNEVRSKLTELDLNLRND